MHRLTADRKSKLVSDLVHAAPQFTQAASTQSTEKTAKKELANQQGHMYTDKHANIHMYADSLLHWPYFVSFQQCRFRICCHKIRPSNSSMLGKLNANFRIKECVVKHGRYITPSINFTSHTDSVSALFFITQCSIAWENLPIGQGSIVHARYGRLDLHPTGMPEVLVNCSSVKAQDGA